MDQHFHDEGHGDDEELSVGKPLLSYKTALIAYGVLAGICALTLRGDAQYIALLIIGALAIKTWLAHVKSRLD
jgi:hypothetical protein